MGQPPSIRVPTFRLHTVCPRQGSPIFESRGDLSGAILAPEAVVPGSLGAPGGCASPSAYAEGSTQTTALLSFSSEPPRASHDWLLYCEQSARHLGFSSREAHQLTHCRRSSTRMNYQARWVTYRAWCHRHGHSISHLSISKIADFLYLHRSLHLSYSSITLCSVLFFALSFPRSLLTLFFMTSCTPLGFKVLFHPLGFRLGICCGLFRFFGVLPLNRLPLAPCGISPVRYFSSSLWPLLTKWVYFRLCLHRSPFRVTIFSYRIFPSSGPSPCPHPTLFLGLFVSGRCGILWVTYLTNYYFVLCALYGFICIVLPLSPRPLFVSPRTPTRPLSKNALSFFLRSVILQSLPSPSSFHSSSSRSSSIRAHSIRGMATSAAFA